MSNITLIPKVLDSSNTRSCWFHEFLRDSDTLVIAVGDSWTWGDSLGKIDFDNGIYDDYEHRTTHIYGRLIADKMDADFLNVAKCGGWNSEIFDNLKKSLLSVRDNYKKIYVFVTLTEICRELWGDPLWLTDDLLTVDGADDFLQLYEGNMFQSFKELIDTHPEIKFVIARNFTYSYDNNIDLLSNVHTDKTWVDCLQDHQDNKNYPDDVRFLSALAFVPLHKRLKKLGIWRRLKYQFMEHYASVEMADTWLYESELNYKKATKHPTERGHQIWADYLHTQIK